jgi:hypothetical protein
MAYMNLNRLTVLLSALFLCSCATGPKFSDVEHRLAPSRSDAARIYIYRLSALLGAAIQPAVLLDGRRVGASVPGGVFFVDVEPGKHVVSIKSDDELILPVTAVAGRVYYVRMMVEPSTWTTNVRPVLVEEDIGQHEIRSLSLVQE